MKELGVNKELKTLFSKFPNFWPIAPANIKIGENRQYRGELCYFSMGNGSSIISRTTRPRKTEYEIETKETM